jgi:hypothetical protein
MAAKKTDESQSVDGKKNLEKENLKLRKDREKKQKEKEIKEKKRIDSLVSFPIKTLTQFSFIIGCIFFILQFFGKSITIVDALFHSFIAFSIVYLGGGILLLLFLYVVSEGKKREQEEKRKREAEELKIEAIKQEEELQRLEELQKIKALKKAEEDAKKRAELEARQAEAQKITYDDAESIPNDL